MAGDLTVQEFRRSGADFAANRLPPPWHRTYPIGLDVEACTFAGLERAWKEADQPHQREHVMPYFYEGIPAGASVTTEPVTHYQSPRGFRVVYLNHSHDYGSLRWTVDTPEDLELIRQVYQRFEGRDDFSWLDVLALFEQEPELANINAGVTQKTLTDTENQGNAS